MVHEPGKGRERKGKKKTGKKERNKEHPRDPSANRSNSQSNPIPTHYSLVIYHPLTAPKQVEKEENPQDSQKSMKKMENVKKELRVEYNKKHKTARHDTTET